MTHVYYLHFYVISYNVHPSPHIMHTSPFHRRRSSDHEFLSIQFLCNLVQKERPFDSYVILWRISSDHEFLSIQFLYKLVQKKEVLNSLIVAQLSSSIWILSSYQFWNRDGPG